MKERAELVRIRRLTLYIIKCYEELGTGILTMHQYVEGKFNLIYKTF